MTSWYQKTAQTTQTLVLKGANVNLTNRKGNTPLHVAARGGCLDTVRVLLAAGASPWVRNREGFRPIDFCKNQAVEQLMAQRR